MTKALFVALHVVFAVAVPGFLAWKTGRAGLDEETRFRPSALAIGLVTFVVLGLVGLVLASYLSIGVSCFVLNAGPDCEHVF